MPGFGDLVQKAFYLGVGAASLAAEKAGTTLAELKVQAQKLADEMVARGEITADEAKRMVDEMVSRAQQQTPVAPDSERPNEPRRIEILVEDEPAEASDTASPNPASDSTSSTDPNHVDQLRQQVVNLQEELRRLKRE
jgi:polyhydroxyalkanoate synthesis regulator phasin